jgi:hypothetical protein
MLKKHIPLESIPNEYHTKLSEEHYRNNTITRDVLLKKIGHHVK